MKLLINILLVIGFLDSFTRFTDCNTKLGYKITYTVTMFYFLMLLIWFNFGVVS